MIGDAPEGLLSSEQVDALRSATVVLLDRFFADIGHLEAGGDFSDTDMVEYLPARFLPRYDHLFAKEFLVCVAMVAWKLVQPGHSMLASVGEELTPNSVSTYQHRHPDLPQPVVDLGEGRCKLLLRPGIEEWARQRGAAQG